MSIETTIKIAIAIFGLLAGFYGRRLYKRWRFWRCGFRKGQRITMTVSDADGEHEYIVKKVKGSTLTLKREDEERDYLTFRGGIFKVIKRQQVSGR